MLRFVLALAALAVGVEAAPVQAQVVAGVGGRPRFRAAFPVAGGVGFSYQRRGLWVGGFAGGVFARSVFVAPSLTFAPFPFGSGWCGPAWGFGWGPAFYPWAGLIGWAPFVGLGVDPLWGLAPPLVPPPVLLPPPVFLGRADGADGRVVEAVAAAPVRADPQPLLRRADFLVIEPKKPEAVPAVARAGPMGGAGGPAERLIAEARPAFAFDPFARRFEVGAERPEADPERELSRLLDLGRTAFAAGQYGRAAEMFERAAAVAPRSARPRFLKAQAAFAAGNYATAVAAIREGLDLDPDWPAGTFDPKEPYGANAAAFAVHLADLRAAVAAHPGEPTLAFLLGYQLWFVGERAEARRWFAVAAGGRPPAGPLACFR